MQVRFVFHGEACMEKVKHLFALKVCSALKAGGYISVEIRLHTQNLFLFCFVLLDVQPQK